MDYSKLAKIADGVKVTVGAHNDPKPLYKQYRDLSYDITNGNKELQNLKSSISEGLTDRIKNSIEGAKNVRVKVDLEGVSPEGVRYPVTITFEKDGSKKKKVVSIEDLIANNYKISDAKKVEDTSNGESITPEQYAELVKDWTDESKVKFNIDGHKVVMKSEVWNEEGDIVYNLTVRVDNKTVLDLVETDSIPVPDYDRILRAVSEVSDSKTYSRRFPKRLNHRVSDSEMTDVDYTSNITYLGEEDLEEYPMLHWSCDDCQLELGIDVNGDWLRLASVAKSANENKIYSSVDEKTVEEAKANPAKFYDESYWDISEEEYVTKLTDALNKLPELVDKKVAELQNLGDTKGWDSEELKIV